MGDWGESLEGAALFLIMPMLTASNVQLGPGKDFFGING